MISRALSFPVSGQSRTPRPTGKVSVLLFFLVALSGCLTRLPSTSLPAESVSVVSGVPARVWADRECGAGALSTVLEQLSVSVSEADLFRELPKAKNGGILPIDLVLAARGYGLDAHLERGSAIEVVKLVTAGSSPILMLRVADFPGQTRDLFHYVVADGVTSDGARVRLLFGDAERRWSDFDNLDRAWRGGGYAMVVVRPRIDAADPPAELVASVIALEQSGDTAAAVARYRELSGMFPRSALVATNLGNVEMVQGRTASAEESYMRALALDPNFRDALNNLAWLLLVDNRELERAQDLAARAVALGGRDSDTCADTLARIQVARGDCAGAARTYRNALEGVKDGAREELLQAMEELRNKCVDASPR